MLTDYIKNNSQQRAYPFTVKYALKLLKLPLSRALYSQTRIFIGDKPLSARMIDYDCLELRYKKRIYRIEPYTYTRSYGRALCGPDKTFQLLHALAKQIRSTNGWAKIDFPDWEW